MVTVRRFAFNPFVEHSYLVSDEDGTAAVIDPGFFSPEEGNALLDALDKEQLRLAAVLLTHAHPDHIYGVKVLQDRFSVPVYMNPEDGRMLPLVGKMAASFGLPAPRTDFSFTPVSDEEHIKVGKMEFKVMATPGHTPGGVCYICEEDRLVFTGDTLFAGSIGRTDLPLGDYDRLIVSVMDKVMGLDADYQVLPGHGGTTTISDERTGNPFLEPFNEPESDISE